MILQLLHSASLYVLRIDNNRNPITRWYARYSLEIKSYTNHKILHEDNSNIGFNSMFQISQRAVLDLCQIQNSKVERQLLLVAAVSGSRRARGALIWKLAVCPSRPLILLL